MKRILLGLIAVSIVGTIACFGYEAKIKSEAKLGQIVAKSASDEMFGGGGTPIGSPEQFLISDAKAWGPPDEKGVATIDDAYLKKNGIYPTQLKTALLKGNIAKLVFAIFALIGVVGLGFVKKKQG